MATSESEDFESADEDIGADDVKARGSHSTKDVKKSHSKVIKAQGKLSENVISDKGDEAENTNKVGVVEANKEVHEMLNKKLNIDELRSEKESVVSAEKNVKVGSSTVEAEHQSEVEGWEDDLGELDDGDVLKEEGEEGQQKQNAEEAKFGSVLDRLTDAPQKAESSGGSWGSWGGWGVSSLLSTATESVSTLTSHVSQGLNTVLEAGLGAPSPEELARLDLERERTVVQDESSKDIETKPQVNEEKAEDNGGLFGLGRVMSGVSSITKLVETAGTKVVSGGLDTLETIGKKTMDILQEGDPGLKKKRAYFSNKILLSQVLREAKEKAEQDHKELADSEAARKAHFETLFDDYQGLVHLEALEMLSKQCDLKLQSHLLTTTGSDLIELQQTLNDLKEQCQLPEEEDLEETPPTIQREKLATLGKGLGVLVITEKLTKTWDETEQWLKTCCTSFQSPTEGTEIPSAREVHQNAMGTMAKLTAESVEQFHKVAELLLVLEERNPSEEAKILLDMTSTLCSLISTTATRFSECLNASPECSCDNETVTSLITNIFLEAAHSSSYIQEAFQLLVPVLQVGLTVT